MSLRVSRQTIGSHIRLRRNDLGLTQGRLAKEIGVSVKTLRKIELGRSSLPFESAPTLVRILQLGDDVSVLYKKPVKEWG